MQSEGLDKTRALATKHAQSAVEALSIFPESESKDALIHLCYIVLSRNK